jgi:hypothetical protein
MLTVFLLSQLNQAWSVDDHSPLEPNTTQDLDPKISISNHPLDRSVNEMRANAGSQSIYIENAPAAPTTASSQLCKTGFYCGNQLHRMGYTNVLMNILYECDSDHDGLFYHKCPHGYDCVEDGNDSYCKCIPGIKYCGYELRKFNYNIQEKNDHTLFVCETTHRAMQVDECSHLCGAKNNGDSLCVNSGMVSCAPGTIYCGMELTAKKFNKWSPHVLYECMESNSATQIGSCQSGCVADTVSRCDTGYAAIKPQISE